jgi:hypothetical protein
LAGAGRSLGHERARQRRASSDDRLARETLAHPVLKPSQMGSTTGPSDRPLRPECGPRRRLTWGTLSGRSDSRDSDRHGEPAKAPGCLCACIGMRDSPRLSKIRDSGSQARFTGTAALIRSLAGRLRTSRQCRLPIRARSGARGSTAPKTGGRSNAGRNRLDGVRQSLGGSFVGAPRRRSAMEGRWLGMFGGAAKLKGQSIAGEGQLVGGVRAVIAAGMFDRQGRSACCR